ncbi:MAG: PEP-CTERM sorting domain-containing protein [Candidatus Korobacteraceae bacterium]
MRLLKLTTLVALSALLLLSVPAFAGDIWTVIPQPNAQYTGETTNYGGGDGSLNQITSLGPFLTYSNPQTEVAVGSSWATWNCPPATESCTPNALWNQGFSTLHITVGGNFNTAGFELEPDQFQQEDVQATFNASDGMSFTLDLMPNGSGGALLYAVQDDTPGSHIVSIDIVDNAGDDFATAQYRLGNSGTTGTTPEPSSMILLGSGLLGVVGFMRRKMNL